MNDPVRLTATGPFYHQAALALLTAHAIPGAERVDGDVYRRVLTVNGHRGIVTIQLDTHGAAVEFDRPIANTAAVAAIVRRWLDLDADTVAIDGALSEDPLLAPLIRHRPGLRLIGHPDEFEAVATTIIGQQVSLAAARTFAGRLVAAHGDRVEDLRAFPDAVALARLGPGGIQQCAGLTRTRARTLHEAARRWADGPMLAGLDADEARRLLLAMPGIGPWTADYLLVRALQRPDTFAPGDLVARRALGLDQREAAERAVRWSPYRSYALLHLWTDAAYL